MNITPYIKHWYGWLRNFPKLLLVKFFLPSYLKKYADSDTESIFENKRVALVGPAISAFENDNGDYINQFDVIVRINYGPRHVNNSRYQQNIGSRTDVLFHNLNEDGGQFIDFDLYKTQGLKYLVTYFRHDQNYINFWTLRYLRMYRNNLKNKLIVVKPSFTKTLSQFLYPNSPTTGMVAIYTILRSNFKEFFITGITFGTTAYMTGYNPRQEAKGILLSDVLNYSPKHSTAKELPLFKTLIITKRKQIVLDNALSELIR